MWWVSFFGFSLILVVSLVGLAVSTREKTIRDELTCPPGHVVIFPRNVPGGACVILPKKKEERL